jgi:hypothetical protein
MASERAGKQERVMTRWTRLLSLTVAVGVFAVLFPLVSALGGLGPAELSSALLVTLPAAFVLLRATTLLLGLRVRPQQAEA